MRVGEPEISLDGEPVCLYHEDLQGRRNRAEQVKGEGLVGSSRNQGWFRVLYESSDATRVFEKQGNELG